MKYVFMSLLFMFAVNYVSAQTTTIPAAPVEKKKEDKKAPEIKFKTDLIDYGTIEQKADGEREFVFKNTGKSPLVISNCVGSCGCTVPTWPKEPIKPGKTAAIKVKYDTNRLGHFEKNVTVTSNAKNGQVMLKIKGDVKAPENKESDNITQPTATPTH